MAETQFLLGKLIEGNPSRDTVHIAVAPVMCAYGPIKPGARVTLSLWDQEKGPCAYAASDGSDADGIADPYLSEPIQDGQKFFLFLFPNTITGLRHEWSHPAFPTDRPSGSDPAVSEKWLRDYAERYRAAYDDMVKGAISRDGYCFGDDDGPPNYRGAETEFWHHIEVVTGKKFSEDHRENTTFRCAC